MLDVRGIAKHYGDVVALDGVSLSVARGQLVGFLGPNGAGKTTTMRAILQLVALDGGTITWDRSPITPAIRRRFGYMPAERGMYPKMRVRDHVVYMARLAGLDHDDAGAAADRWLDRVGLTDRADAEVQDLSSGNQQRVQLALALVNDPELLVLDEPFSGLDPVAVEVLKDVLLERVAAGAALLFSSHQLDLVEDLTRDVVIIDGGRVVLEGDVEAIRQGATSREVEVHFGGPTTWDPDGELPGATLTSRDGDRLRLRVPATTTADEVLAAAGRHGTVTSFSFAPPDLSEVFLATVGRPRPDGPSTATSTGGDGTRPQGAAR